MGERARAAAREAEARCARLEEENAQLSASASALRAEVARLREEADAREVVCAEVLQTRAENDRLRSTVDALELGGRIVENARRAGIHADGAGARLLRRGAGDQHLGRKRHFFLLPFRTCSLESMS